MFSRKQMDQNIHFVLSASFNAIIRTKQSWCIFSNPNSLAMLYLFNKVETNVIFLGLKCLILIIPMFFCNRNAQVIFVTKTLLEIISFLDYKHGY